MLQIMILLELLVLLLPAELLRLRNTITPTANARANLKN